MKTYRTPLIIAAATVAFTASSVASASSFFHPDASERGGTMYPDHSLSSKTRADVNQELADLKKRGLFGVSYNSFTIFQSRSGLPGKSREQVQAELRDTTPEERQKWADLYGKS